MKSLLNDGWAAKIHDLVYKPKTNIDPEVRRQVDIIGGMVNGLEKMSDGLRVLVTRNHQIENERRTNAIFVLMSKTLDAMSKDGTKDELSWYRQLVNNREFYKTCEDNDPKLGALIAAWRKIFAKRPHTQIGCRLLLLLALIRRSQAATSDAFAAIKEWEASVSTPKDRVKVKRFRSTSHWMLGQHDEAIRTCRQLLTEKGVPHLARALTRIDLAYYLAERSFVQNGNCTPALLEEIERLTADWENTGWGKTPPDNPDRIRGVKSRQDSIGAIRIMTARTADGVFAGHQLCSEARAWSIANLRDEELFEDFYKLHTERARRRIQELPPL